MAHCVILSHLGSLHLTTIHLLQNLCSICLAILQVFLVYMHIKVAADAPNTGPAGQDQNVCVAKQQSATGMLQDISTAARAITESEFMQLGLPVLRSVQVNVGSMFAVFCLLTLEVSWWQTSMLFPGCYAPTCMACPEAHSHLYYHVAAALPECVAASMLHEGLIVCRAHWLLAMQQEWQASQMAASQFAQLGSARQRRCWLESLHDAACQNYVQHHIIPHCC